MKALEHRLPPPLLMLATGAIMSVALLDQGAPALSAAWRWGLASLFFVAAGLVGFPAFSAFGKAKTTINPVDIGQASSLVTTGIYGLTRNPMYVALALLLCGWAAWIARPLPLLGPVVFFLFITRFQIIPEERALAAKFGAAYADYCRNVRRWL
ncbi:MAG: isoprenylcysteine carboxylmethyltransferase family protein [Acetobacteraceae bacterium]|nr:isoprenylcysteine carboxylmethyltransferase family protein [Acetobacteraceae bacterium]